MKFVEIALKSCIKVNDNTRAKYIRSLFDSQSEHRFGFASKFSNVLGFKPASIDCVTNYHSIKFHENATDDYTTPDILIKK